MPRVKKNDYTRISIFLSPTLLSKLQKLANQSKSPGARKGAVSREIRRILEGVVYGNED
jgi:hypothetical protein